MGVFICCVVCGLLPLEIDECNEVVLDCLMIAVVAGTETLSTCLVDPVMVGEEVLITVT